MPYKCESEHFHLGRKRSRRVKIRDTSQVFKLYDNGKGMGIRALARYFGVDKRCIQFILFPERLARNKELLALRGGSKIYYDRDKNTKAVREHRRYKHRVFNEVNKNTNAPK